MKKAVLLLLLCIISLAVITSRSSREVFIVDAFFEMGTIVQITIPKKYANLLDEAKDYMHNLSIELSEDSLHLSGADSYVEISKDSYQLILNDRKYNEIQPKFGIKSYTVASLYGFPSGPFKIPDNNELEKAISTMINNSIEVSEKDDRYYADPHGLSVDFGAYGKGWIVDQVASFFRDKGVNNFLINAGGDIYANGNKNGNKWSVGIVDPFNKDSSPVQTFYIEDAGFATSGNYERSFHIHDDNVAAFRGRVKEINHIFDATTGETVSTYKSVSVLASNAELADAFATIIYLSPIEEIESICLIHNLKVTVIDENGEIYNFCQ